MKIRKSLWAILSCCALCGLFLSGCHGGDVKQEPGQGGKSLTDQERKDKRGE